MLNSAMAHCVVGVSSHLTCSYPCVQVSLGPVAVVRLINFSTILLQHQPMAVLERLVSCFGIISTMARGSIAEPSDKNREAEPVEEGRRRTLGKVRLRHHETGEIILMPAPSSDP